MPYTIRLTQELEDKLDNKATPQRKAVSRCLDWLRLDPRHPGLKTKKMQARGGVIFESRASKGDRVTWFWDGPIIVIENHCQHNVVEGR